MKLWTLLFVLHATGLSSGQALYQPTYQQGAIIPGQPSLNYPGGPVNIQQLEAQQAYNPGLPQNYIQGTPIGNQQPGYQQQGIPYGTQQNGIPYTGYPNTIVGNPIQQQQQPYYPTNQQFIPQTSQFGNVPGPGPITFPR